MANNLFQSNLGCISKRFSRRYLPQLGTLKQEFALEKAWGVEWLPGASGSLKRAFGKKSGAGVEGWQNFFSQWLRRRNVFRDNPGRNRDKRQWICQTLAERGELAASRPPKGIDAEGEGNVCFLFCNQAGVAEWQTHQTQNLAPSRA